MTCKVWVCTSTGHWAVAKGVFVAIGTNRWKPAKGIWYRPTTRWTKHCPTSLPVVGVASSGHVGQHVRMNAHATASNYDSLMWEMAQNHGEYHELNQTGLHVSYVSQRSNDIYWFRLKATNAWGTTYGLHGTWLAGTAHENHPVTSAQTHAAAPYIRGASLPTIHVHAGQHFSFAVAGWGNMKTVYWQYKQGSGAWTKLSGSDNHNTYGATATSGMNGRYFRLYGVGNNGENIYSVSGKLVVS